MTKTTPTNALLRQFIVVLLILGSTIGVLRGEGYIALVAAYQNEKDAIIRMLGDDLTVERTELVNGTRFVIGEAFGKDVIIFLTRVSIPNAAMTTQLALSHYPIHTLLFSGVAGAVNPDLAKGDVAIPSEWIYHSEGIYFNEDPENPGEYLSLPNPRRLDVENFKFHFPAATNAVRRGHTQPITMESFPVDPFLLKRALEISYQMDLTNAEGQPARIHVGGNGAAGPVFLDNAKYRQWMFDNWGTESVDMESTAIAHVCWTNNVPCLIIRSISDLAGAQKGENEFPEFARMAELNAARFLVAFLKAL